MSPVSRGHETNNGKPQPVQPESDSGSGHSFDEVLRVFLAMSEEQDPLQAEMLMSSVLGEWWHPSIGQLGEDRGRELVEYASEQGTPEALGLLRVLSALGLTEEQRRAAELSAAELAGRGVTDADWVANLEPFAAGECWCLSDAYGEHSTVLCSFERGGRPHGLVVVLDRTGAETQALDAFPVDDPDGTLAEMRAKEDESEGILAVQSIPQSGARQLIELGIANTDAEPPGELESDFTEYRALALARCRSLAEPEQPPGDVVTEISAARQGEMVAEIEQAVPELAGSEGGRFWLEQIVAHGCAYDPGRPHRVGPDRLTAFFEEWLDDSQAEDAEDAMRLVLPAWTRWAAGHNQLPERAASELVEFAELLVSSYFDEEGEDEELDLDELLEFAEEFDTDNDDDGDDDSTEDDDYDEDLDDEDEDEDSLLDYYLDGTEDVTSAAELGDLLSRRGFAVPTIEATVGDDHFEELDPRIPEERRLLILGEHPEYQQVLDDPEFDGEIDGVNPRLHLAIKEIVISQLWDGEPAETWQAAKRLLAADMDRAEIIAAIGELVTRHLYAALTGDGTADEQGYRSALDRLGRPASGG